MAKKPNNKVVRILNCTPSQGTEKDWGYEDAATAMPAMAAAQAAFPGTVDMRENWYDIGDQMDTGSCVGWGVGDSVIRWQMADCGRINQQDHLSVRYLWMASKETDQFITRPTTFIESDGTSIKAALDIARKFGMVLEGLVPFMNRRLYLGSANNFYAVASQLKINAYFNLGTNQSTWRRWLATKGPIATRLDVDATWDNATNTGGKLEVFQPTTTRGGHAVALVGYTPDYFIVRNSWGTSWGDKGYAYALPAYAAAAFTEAYGVSV
jgi:hypothetical protein